MVERGGEREERGEGWWWCVYVCVVRRGRRRTGEGGGGEEGGWVGGWRGGGRGERRERERGQAFFPSCCVLPSFFMIFDVFHVSCFFFFFLFFSEMFLIFFLILLFLMCSDFFIFEIFYLIFFCFFYFEKSRSPSVSSENTSVYIVPHPESLVNHTLQFSFFLCLFFFFACVSWHFDQSFFAFGQVKGNACDGQSRHPMCSSLQS